MKSAKPPAEGQTRRSWLDKIGLGALLASVTGMGYALVRSLVPDVLYEQPQRFKAGAPDQFPEGGTFLEDQRVYIFREQKTFYAISAACTHLGCTVKMVNPNNKRESHCPCHGSKYQADGVNYSGPAPRPLDCQCDVRQCR